MNCTSLGRAGYSEAPVRRPYFDPLQNSLYNSRGVYYISPSCGEMSEWLKEHAWKACVR